MTLKRREGILRGVFISGFAVLSIFRRRLVADVRQAWKWGSIRFIALGAAVEAVLGGMPRRMADSLPDWVMQSLSGFALLCLLAAGIARITIPKDGGPSDSEKPGR